MITKTIYICPVEGSVEATESHTHKYDFYMKDKRILIVCHIIGYMNDFVEIDVIETTKDEIIRKINLNPDIVDGGDNIDELFNDITDSFIETIVWLHYQTDKGILNR